MNKSELDEQIKELKNTATLLWEEGFYAKSKSIMVEKATESLEKLANLYYVVDSACVTWGFVFDLDNPRESVNKLICTEIKVAEELKELNESLESESLEIPDSVKTEKDFRDWIDDDLDVMQELNG